MEATLRVVAFDLDDTLTVSKSKIDPRMAQLLAQLLSIMDVCIISGGKFEQFETQVLRYIDAPEDQLSRLHIMPTCGTRYYTWRDGDWHLNYAEDLSDDQKSLVINVLTEGAERLGFWESQTWGDIIEDRGSQITYSALGQAAPPDAKYAWDPDGSKKRKLRDYAASYLPDLEVRVGGSTSVDVTRKGIDKAYGISRLCDRLQVPADQILFIGDRLEEGGNDYPVIALGVRLFAVTRWQDTAEYIAQFIDEQSGED
jgi:HAD superfamily hydrolase (TIGR01484 family)